MSKYVIVKYKTKSFDLAKQLKTTFEKIAKESIEIEVVENGYSSPETSIDNVYIEGCKNDGYVISVELEGTEEND